MSLKDKNVVVTGGAGALGQAAVSVALSQGATVHVFDVVEADVPAGATAYKVDLLDSSSIAEAVAAVGKIDALFNIAGGFSMGPLVHEQDQQEWQKMFAINVDTLRNMIAAVVPGMLDSGGGKIVNVGALGAVQGNAMMGAYGAAKGTVMRLTESLSEELKTKGINVNAVLPSIIDTPANRDAMPDADYSEWVPTEDLANVICFLGSDAAKSVHGALVPVKGLS